MEQQKLEWFYNKIVELQTDMYRFAYSVLKSSDQCEDAVHNAILKAHDNLHQLKNEEAFRAWMFRIIWNECLAIVKKQIRYDNVLMIYQKSQAGENTVLRQEKDICKCFWKALMHLR